MSVGVPGTVATWANALQDYGTMSLADVLAPGIHVARDGYVIDQTWYDQANSVLDWFDDIPATRALFLDPDGTPRDVGSVFTNPELAATYERIAHLGAKGFYRGAIADALVATVDHPPVSPTASNVFRPGVMTMRDLHSYGAPERAPTHVSYRGLDVYSMGPPSSGGSTVGEALNILEGYPLSTMARDEAFHYYLEASRYSFADRNAYLADPAYYDVPLSGLLSKDYASTRRALIGPVAANPPVVAPGNPYPYVTGEASATVTQSETTTHLVTSDSLGNVVSYTFTIESTGARRAGLRVPAQQRADRLQLRLADAPEPRRGWQATAELDEPDDRSRSRQAVPRARLAGRVDDHHDRAPDPLRPSGRAHVASGCDCRCTREPAEHGTDERRAGVPHEHARDSTRDAGTAVHERRRDRRRGRDRVSLRREGACSGRTGPARRWQRDGPVSLTA